MKKKKIGSKLNVLVGANGMEWIEKKKPTPHWDSASPYGYFIVEQNSEDDAKANLVYAVYKGDYDDWYLQTGVPLMSLGEYSTLVDALEFSP